MVKDYNLMKVSNIWEPTLIYIVVGNILLMMFPLNGIEPMPILKSIYFAIFESYLSIQATFYFKTSTQNMLRKHFLCQ